MQTLKLCITSKSCEKKRANLKLEINMFARNGVGQIQRQFAEAGKRFANSAKFERIARDNAQSFVATTITRTTATAAVAAK